MSAENIMGLVTYLIVAGVMAGIGIFQIRSKKPVGFYSGEKPPKENELSDVNAWNKKHGSMWVIYGAVIMLSYGIGTIMGDTVWCILPMCGGLLIPVPIMIWFHHRLIRKYKK